AGGAGARPDAATPPAAAAITGVDPVVAERGGTVTIAGRGFGGPNVRITVGGVAADVVSASGSKATFRVPRLAGPGATTVQATNPGGQSGKIDLDVRFDGHVAPVPASAAGVTKTVGRDGGTLAAGGMTLTVPAGALS